MCHSQRSSNNPIFVTIIELAKCNISDDLCIWGLINHTKSTIECGNDEGPFHLNYILFVHLTDTEAQRI